MTALAPSEALATRALTGDATHRAVKFAGLALLGTLVLALSAKINVPFYPVPQTLQTLAVFGIAAAFGRNLAVATMVLYLAEGLVGLPVFAGPTAGPAYMVGPTAGYLAGFVVSAAIVGEAADRGWSRSIGWMSLAMLAGNAIVFALGWAWLASLIGPAAAFSGGVAPFILGGLVKIALAAGIVAALWKLVPPRG